MSVATTSPVVDGMSMAVRLIILVLLSLALWDPKLAWKKAPIDLFLLLDDSDSAKTAWNTETWKQIGDDLRKFPGATRVFLIRFAAVAITEFGPVTLESDAARSLLDAAVPPRSQAIDGSSTNLGAALSHALRLTRPDRQSIFWIVGDGRQTRGEATRLLTELRRRGTPVLLSSPESAHADSRIGAVFVPTTARVGQQVPVMAELISEKDVRGFLELRVAGELREYQPLRLRAGQTATAQFMTATCPPGPCLIGLSLMVDEDAMPQNNRREVLLAVQGPPSLLYVQARAEPAPLADSLAAGGWNVRVVAPDDFPREPAMLERHGLVVLDDIPADALSVPAWANLDQAVRVGGIGLIVLGGPHSFAAGGYRHSLLEGLLPVTAEAANPQESAAVLFMVDKSGSMDREEAGASRLALARQSVLETLKTLRPEDQAGLVAFDAEPRLLLPIKHYAEPAKAFADGFAVNALGGTRLAPALDFALDQLARSPVGQRLLILVTDGILDEKDLEPLKARIAGLSIDLIALVIGGSAKTEVLEELTRLNHGRLLHVAHMAELPRLMSGETADRRNPAETGPILPKTQTPLPFMPEAVRWPELEGYMVTKPKPGSTVHVVSSKQDALVAAHYAGAGRVVAIPGGLANWAPAWLRWSEWGRFAGGLAGWTANETGAGLWDIELRDLPGVIELSVDTDQGSRAEAGRAMVIDPTGSTQEFPLPRTAPGHYEGSISAGKTGAYRFTLMIGDHKTNRAVIHDPQEEFRPAEQARQDLERWRAAGLLGSWSGTVLEEHAGKRSKASVRPLLLALALVAYLVLVITERSQGPVARE